MLRIQKFFINIKIRIKDFVLETVGLFDTGADSKCIQEGLIPTKYFEKTSEQLSTASGSKLRINFKLSEAVIENQNLRIKTSFLLVKDLSNGVILGTPFIRSLFPLNITSDGIFTKYLGETISFPFLRKPISKRLNLIQTKQNQINFLKEEISFKNIESQLSKIEVQKKIQNLLEHIQTSICSDLPNAFWQRKKHVVNLPYEKDFHERQIPTKARPIQMNEDLLVHC